MKALLLAVPLLLLAAPMRAQDMPPLPQEDFKDLKVECIPAARGEQLIDQQGCIAGRVVSATVSKNGNQHLSLCAPRSGCSFHVVVEHRDRRQVGDVTYLRGKLVAFSGEVKRFRGNPRMVVRARDQIHVTAGSTPPEFDTAQPKAQGHGARGGRKAFGR
ncbi:MAG: hypothetical protein P4M01_06660 [Acidobacteriota bacterium]|nr:hypothetical protein [Acidobacteriota bacterium]